MLMFYANISIGWEIALIVFSLLAGGIAGFFISRVVFKKELKKNPPINEKMIRALYMQMGRKPSESQVRAALNAMNQYK